MCPILTLHSPHLFLRLFLSTLWVLGIKLRPLGLVARQAP